MKQINSKAELMRELQTNPQNIEFKTIAHEFRPELVGQIRTPGENGTVQTNAFTLQTTRPDNSVVDAWIWLNEVTLENGVMKYKQNDIEYSVYVK